MRDSKKNRLKAAGWKAGSATDFLDLTPEEAALIDMKLALADHVKRRRTRRGLTQAQLAELLESSQSRVAKTEAADPSVSLDLLVRALLALGATRQEIARALGSRTT